jgi:hypothetical protein
MRKAPASRPTRAGAKLVLAGGVGGTETLIGLFCTSAQDEARAFAAAIARLPEHVELQAATPSNESLLAANLAGGAVSAVDAETWT